MRIVADTNTVISGLLWKGAPRQIIQACRQQRITIVSSESLIAELAEVLARDKFAFRIKGAGPVRYLPQVLVRMRMRVGGVSNRSARNILRKSWEDYRALRANGVGGLGALAWKNLSKLPQFVRR